MKLHDYQKYCVEFIKENPISALFLDCGLGKTVTTLTAINDLMYDYFEVRKVLIIAPLRVARYTWSDEIKNFKNWAAEGSSEQLCTVDKSILV
jgi:superfamily II DNA or RNA helicase